MSRFPPVLPPLSGPGWETGGLVLDSPLMLAPLAGVTIPPVRLFYSRLGASATHTEMISCAGLLRTNRKTAGMLQVLPGEGPVIVQLFAGDSDTLSKGAETALAEGTLFRAVGINMACPMPKVLKIAIASVGVWKGKAMVSAGTGVEVTRYSSVGSSLR